MSKLIRRVEERDLTHIVKVEDKYYSIESEDTIDLGYETKVFECDEYGEIESLKILTPLYTEWHINEESMEDRHNYICEHLEEYL